MSPSILIIFPVLLVVSSTAGAQALPRDYPGIAVAMNNAREPLDACGGRDWFDAMVPDGPFLEACQTHDACYRSAARDQGTCDRDFLADMRASCDVTYPDAAQPLKHAACSLTAWTYFRAVNSRFGALNYPAGDTDGQILNHLQTRIEETDGRDELKVCVTVANTANRVLHYLIVLHDEDGDHAATAPAFRKIKLQPDETKSLCVDTDNAPFASWDSIGDYYSVTLKVDDPDQLSLLGDLIGVDRLDCEKTWGTCRHAAP